MREAWSEQSAANQACNKPNLIFRYTPLAQEPSRRPISRYGNTYTIQPMGAPLSSCACAGLLRSRVRARARRLHAALEAQPIVDVLDCGQVAPCSVPVQGSASVSHTHRPRCATCPHFTALL